MINSKKKLILYELNEVPIKVLEFYSKVRPRSNISYFLEKNKISKTITNDSGELHPWSTWPTVHRGVNNDIHQINFINQDLSQAKQWPPIWEKLAYKDISIGIFGSLQSYPPFVHKNTKFYLPDTFSPSYISFPKDLEIFQRFNLHIVNRNKALTRKFSILDINNFLKLVISSNIKINSIFQIINHIILEIFFSRYKKRRSLMQGILSFDVYEKYLKKKLPDFSTFFTNHVAGMMHRYWKDTFEIENINKESLFNKYSIIKAMDIADNQIGRLLKISKKFNYEIMILSSMGQEAKDWGEYFPEFYIGNIRNLIKLLHLDINNYKLLPAMQPDLCIECKDKESKILLENKINNIKSINGKSLLPVRYKNSGLKLNISIQKCLSTVKNKYILLNRKKIPLSSVGIEIIERDKGTGYHIKEGVLLYEGKNLEKIFKAKKKIINTNKIHGIILEFFNIK